MSDPFIAEIRAFPFNFVPKGWAACNGQLLSIRENTALFSLLGITYGGDGRSTFGLPNLQGAVAMHPGTGPGLTPRSLGETGGTATVTLQASQMPAHSHGLRASNEPGEDREVSGRVTARSLGGPLYAAPGNATPVTLAPEAVTPVGDNQPHNNMMPYLVMNYCIAVQGLYPPRG